MRCAHLSFGFPRMLLNIIAPLQYLDHWNGFFISTDEFENQQSQLALLRTSSPYLLPHNEAATRVKDLKYAFSASRHGTLDALVTYSEAKPTNMQSCQSSLVSLKGPMYLDDNFPFLPNLITPFIGDIFRNT